MSILLFLVDNSAGMYQTAYTKSGRMTFLDLAKRAIEIFVKRRQKIPESRYDRYMLMTFDDPPNNMKVGWLETVEVFKRELGLLEATAIGSLGINLKHAFDALNIQRICTGIDNYGRGRYPSSLEAATIILVTEGRKISSSTGVLTDLTIPTDPPALGADLTIEHYRWDQRLYAIVLRLAGTPVEEEQSYLIPKESTNIESLCRETGGRSFSITSPIVLSRCIQYLSVTIHQECLCRLEDDGPLSDHPAWNTCGRVICLSRIPEQRHRLGIWPIPESYWPDLNMTTLPARHSHPTINYIGVSPPVIVEHFPVDEYIVQTSAFTQLLLCNNAKNTYYSVNVGNSFRRPEITYPFGFFMTDTKKNVVKLCLLPYNYPKLLILMKALFQVYKKRPSENWKNFFVEYLQNIPAYYYGPLRTCFRMMGIEEVYIQWVFPREDQRYLQAEIIERLKSQQIQAHKHINDIQSFVREKRYQEEPPQTITVTSRVNEETAVPSYLADKKEYQFTEFKDFEIGVESKTKPNTQVHLDVVNAPREHLLNTTAYLRSKFFNYTNMACLDEDIKHNIPVSDMGNPRGCMENKTPELRQVTAEPEATITLSSILANKKSTISPKLSALPTNLTQKKASPSTSTPPPSPSTLPKTLQGPLQIPTSYFRRGMRTSSFPVSRMPVAASWTPTGQASTSSSNIRRARTRRTTPSMLVPTKSPENTAGGQGPSKEEQSLSRIEDWFRSIGLQTTKTTTGDSTSPRPGPSSAMDYGEFSSLFTSSAPTNQPKMEQTSSTNPESINLENPTDVYQPAEIKKRRKGKNGNSSISSDEEEDRVARPGPSSQLQPTSEVSGNTASTSANTDQDSSRLEEPPNTQQAPNLRRSERKRKCTKFFQMNI